MPVLCHSAIQPLWSVVFVLALMACNSATSVPLAVGEEHSNLKTVLYRGVKTDDQCAQLCRAESPLSCHFFKFFEDKHLCLLSSHAKVNGKESMEVRDSPLSSLSPQSWVTESSRQQTPNRSPGAVTPDLRLPPTVNSAWTKDTGPEEHDQRRQQLMTSLRQLSSKMATEVAAMYKAQAELAARIERLGSEEASKRPSKGEAQKQNAVLQRLEIQLDHLAKEMQDLRGDLNTSFGDRSKVERELQTAKEITEKLEQHMEDFPTVARDLSQLEEVLKSQWRAEKQLRTKMRTIAMIYEDIRANVSEGKVQGGEGRQVEEAVAKLQDAVLGLKADSDWLTQHVDWEREDLLEEVKNVLAMSLKVKLSQLALDAEVENDTSAAGQQVLSDVRENMKRKIKSVSKKLSHYSRAMLVAITTEKLLRGDNSTRSHGFPGQRELELLSAQVRAIADDVALMRQNFSTNSATSLGSKAQSSTSVSGEDSIGAIRKEEKRIMQMKMNTASMVAAIEEIHEELEKLRIPMPLPRIENDFDKEEEDRRKVLKHLPRSTLQKAIALESALESQEKKIQETRAAMLDAVEESVKRDELQTTIMSRLGKINKTLESLKKEKTTDSEKQMEHLELERIKLAVELHLAHGDFHLAERMVEDYAAKLKKARDKKKELEAQLGTFYGPNGNGSVAALGKEVSIAQGNLSSMTQWREILEKALRHAHADTNLREARRMSTWKQLQSVNRDISQASRGPRRHEKQSLLSILDQQRTQLRMSLRTANQELQDAQKATVDIGEKLLKIKAKQNYLEREVSSKLLEQSEQEEINTLRRDLDAADERALVLKQSVLETRKKALVKENLKDSIMNRLAEIGKAIGRLDKSAESSPVISQRRRSLERERHALKFELREAMHQLHIVQARLVHLNSSFTRAVQQLREAVDMVNQKLQMATLGSVAGRLTLIPSRSTMFPRHSEFTTRTRRSLSRPVIATRSLDFAIL